MAYTRTQKVKFKHCDPAGIVFYPRYFEMINDTVEAWFEDILEHPFAEIHPKNAVPTGDIQTRFTAPSKLGDILNITLEIQRIGTASLALQIETECEGQARFIAALTLIYVNNQGKSEAWPDALRARILTEMETNQ
ncbi:acyl-CoA thioesterase [Halocynthiibacter sp.]|uniref:acyl-CoA thioesterase n=1 Tax=Halocynthiibacter sp. TaxID=1979210 RepID=UPI003C321EC9